MTTETKLRNHLAALKTRHQDLDLQIEEEYRHFQSDDSIAALKKQKLAIKEEIATVSKQVLDNYGQA